MSGKFVLLLLMIFVVNMSCDEEQLEKLVSAMTVNKWIHQKDCANVLSLHLHISVNEDSFYIPPYF